MPVKTDVTPHLAVDLTSLATDGSAGGAWPLTRAIVAGLIETSPECRFTLLVLDPPSADAVSLAAAPNVELRPVPRRQSAATSGLQPAAHSQERQLPKGFRWRLRCWLRPLWRWYKSRCVLGPLNPDLLFCPGGSPNFAFKRGPVVCLIHDLQCLEMPQFFEPLELALRRESLEDVRRETALAVANSEFVCQTLRDQLRLPNEKIRLVPPRLSGRLPALAPETVTSNLAALNLESEKYYFYPANFWPHKNHENLLQAWARFQARPEGAGLRLVLTGAASERREQVLATLSGSEAGGSVVPLGHRSEVELAALFAGSRGLIFPSLYEGFGLPVLEAMHYGRPVLCSAFASLPEVAGPAAEYCDPRNPEDICAGLCRLEADPARRIELARLGRERAEQFADSREMIAGYRRILLEALDNFDHKTLY